MAHTWPWHSPDKIFHWHAKWPVSESLGHSCQVEPDIKSIVSLTGDWHTGVNLELTEPGMGSLANWSLTRRSKSRANAPTEGQLKILF